MKLRSMPLSPAIAGLFTLAAIAPLPAQDATAPAALLLLLQGDADRVTVTHAWRKDFAFHASRDAAAAKAWVQLLDVKGRLLQQVPLDLSHVHFDRARGGRDVLISEDRLLTGDIRAHVKVPDLPELATVEIVRRDDSGAVSFGRVDRATLDRLLSAPPPPQAVTITTHLDSGPSANRYDIVVLGDGYILADQAQFNADVDAWINDLFGREPFKSYQGMFNVHSVFRPSAERGADDPMAVPPIVVDTAYEASYWTGGVERCLYIQDEPQADLDAAMAPDVESSIAVLVNSPKYGGCAGRFAVTYNGSLGPQVQTHEFCHSFGGLADEYGGTGTYTGPEPTEPNVTADPTCAKWASWIGSSGVGCFEGGRYFDNGIWRPADDCLMRASSTLCAVCVEQLTKRGFESVSPIENVQPAAGPVQASQPAIQTFQIGSLVPAATARIQWKVGGQVAQIGGTTFSFDTSSVPAGLHFIQVEVADQTALVRNDPRGLLTNGRTWLLTVVGTAGSATTFGAPCGDPATLPLLDHTGVPRLGQPLDVTLSGAAAQATAVLWVGSRIDLPLPATLAPGCSLYATQDALLPPRLTSAGGSASVSIPIPSTATLVGATFTSQWGVVQAVNPLGVVFSNGGEATIGS
ncbi:MAG: M64 family metallopeptidase [Planctomycetota bacterium]